MVVFSSLPAIQWVSFYFWFTFGLFLLFSISTRFSPIKTRGPLLTSKNRNCVGESAISKADGLLRALSQYQNLSKASTDEQILKKPKCFCHINSYLLIQSILNQTFIFPHHFPKIRITKDLATLWYIKFRVAVWENQIWRSCCSLCGVSVHSRLGKGEQKRREKIGFNSLLEAVYLPHMHGLELSKPL